MIFRFKSQVGTVPEPTAWEVYNMRTNWWRGSLMVMSAVVAMIAGASSALAKHDDDVVVMKNGDHMTGEIKKLQRGELTFKASYMAADVDLDWSKVARLESKDSYLISMTDGHQFAEQFKLEDNGGGDNFLIGSGGQVKVSQMNVLRILPIETRFWKQLEGSIGLGVNYTSGNDQYQTELFATATYR